MIECVVGEIQGYLVKPIENETLVAEVIRLLEESNVVKPLRVI